MKIIHGDCIEKLKELDDNSIDSIVTDPPYGLGFMGKDWDTFDKSQFGKKGEEGENDLKIRKTLRYYQDIILMVYMISPKIGQKNVIEF